MTTLGSIPPATLAGTNQGGQGIVGLNLLLRAVVTAIRPVDDPLNTTGQLLVDVRCFDNYPPLFAVPVLRSFAAQGEGESVPIHVGDAVAVTFFSGLAVDPVVIGVIAPYQVSIDPLLIEVGQYKRVASGTSETIDTEGSRTVYVAKDETLTVVGDGAVIVGGKLDITVTGDATLTAASVTINGDVVVNGSLTADGITSTIDVDDSVTSMAAMRSAYNGHTHVQDTPNPGTTTTPSTAM